MTNLLDDDLTEGEQEAIRDYLICHAEPVIPESDWHSAYPHLWDAIQILIQGCGHHDPTYRETLTQLLLSHSLCPLHFIDYAICFDDEDNECEQIRLIHPSHDT